MVSHQVKLVSVSTAVPPNLIHQRDAAKVAHASFSARYDDFERLVKVFESSGILKRYLVKPLDWYLQPLGWAERNAAYLDGACALFVAAASKALAEAGLAGSDIDTVVTISSTGLATPGIDARVAGQMGFRTDVERVPVFGLGCAGGVTGLGLGARLAASRPGSNVLVVAVELCSVAFRLDKLTKENIVATALFGDGAAACVLGSAGDGIAAVEFSGHHTWPETLDIMGWSVDDSGLGVIFDRAIPPFAEANIAPALQTILGRNGLGLDAVDRFACHPGGAKVITALERALSLDQGTLNHERGVLADYGNMSAPTALFVLDRLVRDGLPPRTLLTAMGPGFTASCVSLQAAA
ncbi:type III polyketide synthase [Paragemmobacter aquarius]|uniref:type III polyketide synthase n=1 Tax=Paragemmobacter aquarius TaxID=2169400 RepID=UPI001E58DE19|nr:type III polyketide synthase [Gemmobacter aquarius]